MQITARQLRSDDLVRGIGLVVLGTNYDENTNETKVVGYVIADRSNPEATFTTSIQLPADHRVNVARRFQVGDLVTIANPEFAASYDEDEDDYTEEQYLRRTVVFIDPESRLVYTGPEGASSTEEADVLAVGFREARFVLA